MRFKRAKARPFGIFRETVEDCGDVVRLLWVAVVVPQHIERKGVRPPDRGDMLVLQYRRQFGRTPWWVTPGRMLRG